MSIWVLTWTFTSIILGPPSKEYREYKSIPQYESFKTEKECRKHAIEILLHPPVAYPSQFHIVCRELK